MIPMIAQRTINKNKSKISNNDGTEVTGVRGLKKWPLECPCDDKVCFVVDRRMFS